MLWNTWWTWYCRWHNNMCIAVESKVHLLPWCHLDTGHQLLCRRFTLIIALQFSFVCCIKSLEIEKIDFNLKKKLFLKHTSMNKFNFSFFEVPSIVGFDWELVKIITANRLLVLAGQQAIPKTELWYISMVMYIWHLGNTHGLRSVMTDWNLSCKSWFQTRYVCLKLFD